MYPIFDVKNKQASYETAAATVPWYLDAEGMRNRALQALERAQAVQVERAEARAIRRERAKCARQAALPWYLNRDLLERKALTYLDGKMVGLN